MAYSSSKGRIVKNTAFLYVRTLLLLVIGVFTSRITLQALGVTGYGTVNVVSGFVGMFSILSGSLTGACQRFLTYEMGAKNYEIREVFNASFKIHLILAATLLLAAETIGIYFVNHKLNIPDNNFTAVQWVYQCSVISFVLSLINIPFNAIIISYERLNIFAYLSLLEGLLKLSVVLLLLYLPGNKLIIYALLTLVSAIIMRGAFQIYCRNQFGKVVKLKVRTDRALFKNIFGFAGLTFLGNTATICSNQGVNIVINIFCGVVANAARGIAVMVEGVITTFVTNFTTALNPQITKSYASGNKDQIVDLIQLGFRISFFLMLIISVPVIIAANEMLNIWFIEVPEYAVSFVRLTLITAMIQALGNPFLALILATGKIGNYQIAAGLITFLNLPISYLLLHIGLTPISVYLLNIVISSLTFFIRLYFLEKNTRIPTNKYFDLILVRMLLCGATCVTASSLYYMLFESIDNIIKFATFCLGSAFISIVSMFYIGINASDRSMITRLFYSKLRNFSR